MRWKGNLAQGGAWVWVHLAVYYSNTRHVSYSSLLVRPKKKSEVCVYDLLPRRLTYCFIKVHY